MAPRGPAPKPAHLRQRTNTKASAAVLESPNSVEVPELPNPDGRTWHPLTVAAWSRACQSPMASQWLEVDMDALGRLALLWDAYYKEPKASLLGEIRLQEQRFGFSPLDRSRLQWEVSRVAEVERKTTAPTKRAGGDPRRLLMAVK